MKARPSKPKQRRGPRLPGSPDTRPDPDEPMIQAEAQAQPLPGRMQQGVVRLPPPPSETFSDVRVYDHSGKLVKTVSRALLAPHRRDHQPSDWIGNPHTYAARKLGRKYGLTRAGVSGES
jgi:hypothetical protein